MPCSGSNRPRRPPSRIAAIAALRTLLLWLLWVATQAAWSASVTKTPVALGSYNCTSLTSGGTKTWNRAYNAWSDNNVYATASVDGTTSRLLQCLNYGFSIPASATINGIVVNVSRKSNRTADGGSRDAFVRLVKGGVVGSIDRATSTVYTTSEVSEAHGGPTDLWGLSWTPAEINAADFGAVFAANKPSSAGKAHKISVDAITITVHYTPDATPPTVASIVRASANPASGSTVAWTVNFSESVTGVDAGDFALAASGVGGASIGSVSGSGSTWTVTASTGSGSGTLGLNLVDNDSVVDPAGNKLGGTGTTGTTNGSLTGPAYTVDRINPNVLSIARSSASPSNAASLSWLVTFSESVSGLDAGDFQLVTTGTVSAAITSVSGSGTTWTVTAGSITGTGTLGLNLVDNDTIVDVTLLKLGGTGLGNGSQTGQVYAVDRDTPTVLQIKRDGANPSSDNTVSWTVTFSETVTGVDSSDFSLVGSGLAGAAIVAVSGSGSTWTVTADPGYGAGTLGLNLVDDDSIVDAVGNKLGGTGAGNGNLSGEVYTVTTPAMASYAMDEASWNGTVDQITDRAGSNPGTALNGATTGGSTPALAGSPGSCRYGIFTSASSPTVGKGYIDLTDDFPYLTDDFTISGWIHTTANGTANQWIFSHNTGGLGYALSLGTAGTGRLRFSSGGASTVNLDSPSTAASLLASNTWYFVAAVADFSGDPSIVRRLYVYDASGNLLSGYPVSLTTTGWEDTESGAATIGGNGSASFVGQLDEIQVFDKSLNATALAALAKTRHACTTAVPDHYELSLPSTSLACLPSTVTVTACADSSSPCTKPFTAAAGGTVTLATSGATLAATTLSLDATGIVTTTLSYPTAPDGTAAVVTLSAETVAASSPRQCCPNGSSCTAANSCSSLFNTAGLIIAGAANGGVATIPTQTAGTNSGTYYLRAVKTGTSNKACEPALTGSTTVNWAAQCNNPSNCSAGSLMTLSAGTSTAVAGNPNSGVTSSTAVTMSFDANGNAPFTFAYNDVGQVTLWASKPVNGAMLAGQSNAFVARPAGFTVAGLAQTASPNLTNPAAANANGSKFVRAGESFSATVTAITSTGAVAPNFGKETTPEGVLLTPALVQPAGGVAGTLSGGNIAGSGFVGGVATANGLTYSEVGIITLTPALADGDYLGTGNVNGTTSGNIGRFVPSHFALTAGTPVPGCSGSFTYFGQDGITTPFTLIAQNTANAVTQNYTGAFAKLGLASWGNFGFSAAGLPAGSALAASATAPTGSWSLGTATISAMHQVSRPTAATAETGVTIRAVPLDSDGVTMAATAVGAATPLRYGRLRLSNAYGSARAALQLPVSADHWSGSNWVLNSADNCTTLPAASIALSNPRNAAGNASAATTSASAVSLSAGQGLLTLAAPSPAGSSVSVDLAVNLGSSAADQSCHASHPATTGAARPWLRGRNGSCAASDDRDPAARATFGIFSPESRKTVHVRQIF